MKTLILATLPALVLLAGSPAHAGEPADAVAAFYHAIGTEAEPENRDRFTGSAKAFLDEADAFWEQMSEPCITFGFSIDAQDYDENEIASTLSLDEQMDGDRAIVTARFVNFGQPTEIVWSLENDGGVWLVNDIASPANGWRLSDMACD